MKNMLIMTVGIPGSGKTTWAEKFANERPAMKIYSSDKLRQEMFDCTYTKEENRALFAELHKRVRQDLAEGHSVIFDATNISCKKRMAFLNEISDIQCDKIAAVMATPFTDCVQNDSKRGRHVGYDVICNMYKHWETPYHFEGWDAIWLLRDQNEKVLWPSEYLRYDQNNPHHDFTLGDHMSNTLKYVSEHLPMLKIKNNALLDAAYFHDVGKPFCRVDKNNISHYPNHANVGAYDALSLYGLSLEASALITYHMAPLSWTHSKDPNKTRNKYKRLWGEEFFNNIMLLNEADVKGGKKHEDTI